MPVHNGERYVSGAIRSLLEQTYSDFELVVSDNASTDGTESICRALAKEDPRIRYVRVPQNRGAAWNFNEVFRQSRGVFFKVAPHDDLYAPTFLERCVEAFSEAPSTVALVYPRTVLIDDDDEQIAEYDDRLDLRQPEPDERLRGLLENYRLLNANLGLHRREVYGSTRLLQAFDVADVVLLAEVALRGELWELPEFLFMRREHAGRSVRAHADEAELTRWYDPARRRRWLGRRTRVFVGLCDAVRRAPVDPQAKMRCWRYLLTEWAPPNGRVMLTELAGAALSRGRL